MRVEKRGISVCGKKESWNGDENDAHDSQVSYAFEQEITSQSLPEGTRLKHLFITHQGMRGGSYYILKTTDAGVYMKISNMSPGNLRMLEGEEEESLGGHANYLGFADTVKDRERAGIDIDISIRCFGEYSYKVVNPLLFYTNVCGNATQEYSRKEMSSKWSDYRGH